jgi:hypothetical protein
LPPIPCFGPAASRSRLAEISIAPQTTPVLISVPKLEKGEYHTSLKITGRFAATLNVDPAEFLKMPATRRSRTK